MSDNEGEVEVEVPQTNQILPKDVASEIGSIKLFNKWYRTSAHNARTLGNGD